MARQSQAVRRQHRVVWFRIGLAAVVTALRSRRFYGYVIAGVIALAALAGLGKESQARTMGRLAVWDKRQNLRRQRTAKARPA